MNHTFTISEEVGEALETLPRYISPRKLVIHLLELPVKDTCVLIVKPCKHEGERKERDARLLKAIKRIASSIELAYAFK